MQQALSALVIHDIKNSLALLEADLEQLNHHDGMPDEARKAYQRCVELKERLIRFLTLYKHEHGALKPNLTEVDLNDFLEDTLAASQSAELGNKHGHAIEVEIDEERMVIAPQVRHKGLARFDEYLVGMALESALNNAVRYAASSVRMWFEQDAERVSLFVLDDGPGLDHPAAGTPSTGVGLALCKAVVEAHGGGKVTLADAADGGALFALELHSSSR